MGKVIQQGKISVSNSKSMYVKLLMAVAVGIIIWFIPTPAGVKTNAWHMFAIFVATIIGCILKPLPIGAVSMIGLTYNSCYQYSNYKSGSFRIQPEQYMAYSYGFLYFKRFYKNRSGFQNSL